MSSPAAAPPNRRDGLPRLGFVFGALLALAVLSRVLPHPPNFTALDAIAIYAGLRLADGRAAFLLPLLAMLIADAFFLGFHSTLPLIYACMAFTVLLGRLARGKGKSATALAAFTGATTFFIVTNLAVWWGSGMYSLDSAGLGLCFSAALPFYQWTLAGLVTYGALLWALDLVAGRLAPQLGVQPA